jgi:hypothetical protein
LGPNLLTVLAVEGQAPQSHSHPNEILVHSRRTSLAFEESHMSQLQPAPGETPESALHHGRLGIFGIVFFVVAAAAPLVGMTGAVPVAIVIGNGAAAPGAYLVAGLVLLLFSVGYAAMATKVTNVGAFFAFVGRGLGIIPGVGSAFVSLVAISRSSWRSTASSEGLSLLRWPTRSASTGTGGCGR